MALRRLVKVRLGQVLQTVDFEAVLCTTGWIDIIRRLDVDVSMADRIVRIARVTAWEHHLPVNIALTLNCAACQVVVSYKPSLCCGCWLRVHNVLPARG